MHPYGVRDVERLLGLSRGTVRALVASGFVTPERGPRNSLRFSFQDLIALRTAQALAAAKVPARRITRSLRDLRRLLPESMPVSGLRVAAEGDRVVVREGHHRWQAESGQYLLEFEGDPADGSLSVIARPPQGAPADTAEDAFDEALSLEKRDPEAAMGAYRRAIALDATHVDSYVNLGLMLHEAGRLEEARTVYARALERCGRDALVLYNTGVLLEDLGRPAEALEAYRAAVQADPDFADGHYNLALLCRTAGRPKEAIRHMAQYRRLTERAR